MTFLSQPSHTSSLSHASNVARGAPSPVATSVVARLARSLQTMSAKPTGIARCVRDSSREGREFILLELGSTRHSEGQHVLNERRSVSLSSIVVESEPPLCLISCMVSPRRSSLMCTIGLSLAPSAPHDLCWTLLRSVSR